MIVPGMFILVSIYPIRLSIRMFIVTITIYDKLYHKNTVNSYVKHSNSVDIYNLK